MKKIELTQGKFSLVDDENYNWLNQYKWYANKKGNTYYAKRQITIRSGNKQKNIKQKQKMILMHREIVERKLNRQLRKDEDIDHINGDGLDNTEKNLRICDSSKNGGNRKKQKGTTSIYKGVCFYKNSKKWMSSIELNQKQKHLGYFNNEIDAAKAYDKAAKELFGEFARLNFEE